MIHLCFIIGIESFIYKCHVITLWYINIAMPYIYFFKVLYLYIYVDYIHVLWRNLINKYVMSYVLLISNDCPGVVIALDSF